MANYDAMLVERVPQAAGAPTLNLIDEIIPKKKIGWSTELIGDGGFITFAAVPDQQSSDVKNILIDIAETACEIWLYRNGVMVQAGPIIGVQTQGPTIVILARSLAYYLRYMFVTADLTYTNIDDWIIGKGLIDHWQALSYGDYGIDTSTIGTSGFTRTIKYVATEAPNIFQRLEKLSEKQDGFEWYVDPLSRKMIFTARRGSDKSASVILDSRAIASPNTYFSVAAGDYANYGIATGATVEGTTTRVGAKTNAVAMAKWGRAGMSVAVDEAETQLVVDDYAQSLVDSMAHVKFIPPVGSAIPVLGASVEDFDAGDTIHWVYDYGLGKFRVNRDVYKRFVSVSTSGDEKMTVEFV